MDSNTGNAIALLNQRYLMDFPYEASVNIEMMSADEAAAVLSKQPASDLQKIWKHLTVNAAASILNAMSEEIRSDVLRTLPSNDALRFLGVMEDTQRERCLELMGPELAGELRTIMTYPQNSAGQLMDSRVQVFREKMSVSQALNILRKTKAKTARSIFIINEEGRLGGMVAIQDMALAEPDEILKDLARPIVATVNAVSSGQEVADIMERYKVVDLPVVDFDGALLGIVYNATLVKTVEEAASAGLQTMVGASKDEKALSTPLFSVRKRLPWLQINLLTAFMAASVVGIFEDTIARFTALAVLLPVVAGQSGNSGAQALAVTMRGLALREITIRDWFAVMVKEASVGFFNGLAVAITCGICVFIWSGSVGLVVVIALSMVFAMVAAGFAGALVPIVLTRLGQDPAQASSIILTTVTDIAGFFAFLGIATLLANMI